MKSNLKTKINLYYLVALFMSFLVSYGIYNTLNERAIEKQVGVSAAQTLQALDKNLDFMLDEVTTFSNLIFFDRDIQNALRNVKLDDPDPYLQNLFNEYIINMLLSGDYISSVYLYDNYSMRYAQGKRGVQPLTIPNIMDAPWYKRALELDGNLMWVLNSGGILKNPTNEGYLSLIRIIKDVRTYEKLAVLIVNVDEKTIVDQFSSISYGNKSHFFVLNENNDYITHPDIDKNIIEDQVKPNLIGNNGHIVKKLEKTKMIISYTTSKISNWRIVGLIPLSDLSKHLRSISYIAILILVVNSIFMTLGGNYITKLITKPLRRMQKYMKKAEQGNFEAIPVDQNRDDEVIQLQKVFNKMVMRIETLIEEVKEEQKIIRKNELALLRAQINPHFLYNTLDAISALSLLGDNAATYKITQSLGDFYRISLNSGAEIVTVEDEISCIMSYITILDIRYNGKFEVEYKIDEYILKFRILKLILQPIVENAIHHGIRNKHGKGKVSIIGYKTMNNLIFKIIDDGVGMNSDKIREVVSSKHKNIGFGIYSSIERIAIFYNTERPMEIKSYEGKGTEVIITIPTFKEDQHG